MQPDSTVSPRRGASETQLRRIGMLSSLSLLANPPSNLNFGVFPVGTPTLIKLAVKILNDPKRTSLTFIILCQSQSFPLALLFGLLASMLVAGDHGLRQKSS